MLVAPQSRPGHLGQNKSSHRRSGRGPCWGESGSADAYLSSSRVFLGSSHQYLFPRVSLLCGFLFQSGFRNRTQALSSWKFINITVGYIGKSKPSCTKAWGGSRTDAGYFGWKSVLKWTFFFFGPSADHFLHQMRLWTFLICEFSILQESYTQQLNKSLTFSRTHWVPYFASESIKGSRGTGLKPRGAVGPWWAELKVDQPSLKLFM